MPPVSFPKPPSPQSLLVFIVDSGALSRPTAPPERSPTLMEFAYPCELIWMVIPDADDEKDDRNDAAPSTMQKHPRSPHQRYSNNCLQASDVIRRAVTRKHKLVSRILSLHPSRKDPGLSSTRVNSLMFTWAEAYWSLLNWREDKGSNLAHSFF